MARRFQFSLRALLQATGALALLLTFCRLNLDAQLAYVKLFLYPILCLPPLILFLLPACGLAHKLGQCLLGRLPPDALSDAEPIRFDSPPPEDEG